MTLDGPDQEWAAGWADITDQLQTAGSAIIPQLLGSADCAAIADLYPQAGRFRSRVVMARHGFGRGEYQYFNYPLPGIVQELRSMLYPKLAGVANRWNEAMGIDVRYPPAHADFLARCHDAGQTKPTPLLLQYTEGDYNCLHQDLYGEHVFPLQVAVLLSRPDIDFSGGEFVLTEQRPRMQSRAEVVPLAQGDAVVFAVHHRPVQGSRGFTASTCGMASARFGQAGGIRWELFFMMRSEGIKTGDIKPP
jgi:hypothetical protein